MPTPRLDMRILSADGTRELTSINWGAVVAGTPSAAVEVRVFNSNLTGDATEARMNVCRGDLLRTTAESADEANRRGDELVAERWLEASPDGSAWVPIDEYAKSYDLGPIAAQAHVVVYLRLNVPAGAASVDEIDFAPLIRSR